MSVVRIPDAESEAPWRCLGDMLQSAVCQNGTVPLVLRTIVGQVSIAS